MSPPTDDPQTASRPDLAFDALAEPVRREILGVLAAEGECSAGLLAQRITSVGRTAVSTHLGVLRNAGLIAERRDGRYRYYSVDGEGSAREVIAVLQSLFQASLDEVRGAVEGRRPSTARRRGAG